MPRRRFVNTLRLVAASDMRAMRFDPSPAHSYTPPHRALAKCYVGLRCAGGARPKHREIVDCGREPG